MTTMRVEVVSSEQSIYSGEATFLVVPTEEGELGIYPRHIPILSKVRPGVLVLTVPGQAEKVSVAISGGLLEVQPDTVTVLAEIAVRADDLDEERALEAQKAAKERLSKAKDEKSTADAQAALASAIAQLKTLEYLRKRAGH